jgi:hypothetical protein
MRPVESSVIQAVGYDPASRELHIQFIDAGRYVYFDVDPLCFDELVEAESKGNYLNRELKQHGYRYERRG